MDVAALGVWACTAALGFILLGTWLNGRGMAQQASGRSRIRTGLIFSHFGLAAAGLALWVLFVVTDSGALAWLALALLPVVAGLGLVMFLKWVGGRGAHAGITQPDPPAEQRFSVLVVGLHGAFAVATLVLVLLAALGVGS